MDLAYWTCKEDGYWFHWEKESPQWSDIQTELEMLCIEGKAERVGDSYVISHDVAASFSRDERELLTLPEVFPYQIYVDKESVLQSNQFRFKVRFLQGDGTPFVNPEVIGSFIRINQKLQFMCDASQYRILQLATAKGEETSDRNEITAYNMENLAQIKEEAEVVEAKLDDYLEQTQVVKADSLDISIEKAGDGTYYVAPVLLDREGTPIVTENGNDFAQTFKCLSKVKPLYTGHGRIHYVFDKEQANGLAAIKEKNHLTEQEAKKILVAPGRVFSSSAFAFNRDDYSDRVIDYNVFLPKEYPYLRALQGGWLPEEGKVSFEPENDLSKEPPPVTIENKEQWEGKIREACQAGQKYVEVDGKKYSIESVEKAIRRVIYAPWKFEGSEEKDKGTTGQYNLISIDNTGQIDYHAVKDKDRADRRQQRYKSLGNVFSKSHIADGLVETVTPFSYQKAGMEWMADNWQKGYKGVLLADDMGLGKTLQTLGFLSGLKTFYDTMDMPSVLIVAPVSLLANWKQEFERFVKPGLFLEIYQLYGNYVPPFKMEDFTMLDLTPLAKNRIILTSYETLRIYDESFGRINWSVMVLDEAQKVKNPSSLITNCVKAMKFDFGIALTGTPVENAWVDLWSIMDFIEPGRLQDLKSFCKTYQNQLKHLRGDVEAIEKLGKQLEGELQPVFLRRQKADYLEGLPKKNVEKREMPMPPEQQQAYEKVIAWGQKGIKKKGDMLKVIAALRDTSLCPHLAAYSDQAFENMAPEEFFNSSARLQAVYQILVQIMQKKEKVLLFVTSKKMQRILKRFLEKAFSLSIQPPINGELSGERRQQIIDTFNQKEGFAILILSAEAGGVGFNITAANHVIHLSRCWNPAKEDQATDRVYRIGQKKEVHVYLPIAICGKGNMVSFDEKLDQLLDFKRSLSRSVIFPTEDTAEDGYQMWQDLFSFGNQVAESSTSYGAATPYWTISDTDRVTGEIFERIIATLYDKIPGYSAEVTPARNDYGADVVVLCDKVKKTGFLLQCKQTAMGKNMSPEGVEQICSAIPLYEKRYGYKFQGVVITNAPDFTENAKTRATAAGVQLIARKELMKLLEKYRIEKELVL